MTNEESDIEYATEERASPEEQTLELERIRDLLNQIEAQATTILKAVDLLPDKQAEPLIEKVEELQETINEQQADLKSDKTNT